MTRRPVDVPLFVAAMLPILHAAYLNAQPPAREHKEPATAEVLAAMRKNVSLDTLYMEMMTDGKSIGLVRSSLSTRGSDLYEYEAEMVVSVGEGARIEGSVKATLNGSMEPVEVETRRELVAPNGKRKTTIHRVDIQDREILHTTEEDGNPATPQNMARPESPFVLALEFLVERIDMVRFPAFSLREFDVQDRTVKTHHFQVESGPSGVRRLVSRKDDGSVGYVFEVDAKGELLSWAEPPLPVVSKACSRERYEELRKSIGR